jgi:hypothetical protein
LSVFLLSYWTCNICVYLVLFVRICKSFSFLN